MVRLRRGRKHLGTSGTSYLGTYKAVPPTSLGTSATLKIASQSIVSLTEISDQGSLGSARAPTLSKGWSLRTLSADISRYIIREDISSRRDRDSWNSVSSDLAVYNAFYA